MQTQASANPFDVTAAHDSIKHVVVGRSKLPMSVDWGLRCWPSAMAKHFLI